MMAVGISTGIPSVLAAASVADGDGNSRTVHIDGRTEQDGNSGIFCRSHFLADFHVDQGYLPLSSG